jgi:hypothetical protein
MPQLEVDSYVSLLKGQVSVEMCFGRVEGEVAIFLVEMVSFDIFVVMFPGVCVERFHHKCPFLTNHI